MYPARHRCGLNNTIKKNWASSASGQNIALTHSHHAQIEEMKQPLILIGGVHGDEPEGVYLAEAALHWLTTEKIQTRLPWIIITCLNPDGYKANERVNGNGVDLNRNYPAKNWSPKFEKDRYFPGSRPSSESEITAVIQLIEMTSPRLIVHCHSWKPCIVCSGPKNFQPAQILAEVSNFEMVYEVGYPTPGSLSSYAWQDRQIPVICIEDEEHRERAKVWPRFGPAMEKIFHEC